MVAATATIRGLSDEDLARSARLAAGAPPMTVEQIITGGLLHHVDDHFGSYPEDHRLKPFRAARE